MTILKTWPDRLRQHLDRFILRLAPDLKIIRFVAVSDMNEEPR